MGCCLLIITSSRRLKKPGGPWASRAGKGDSNPGLSLFTSFFNGGFIFFPPQTQRACAPNIGNSLLQIGRGLYFLRGVIFFEVALIEYTSNGKDGARWLGRAERQIPYATSLALNCTAAAIQKAITELMPRYSTGQLPTRSGVMLMWISLSGLRAVGCSGLRL